MRGLNCGAGLALAAISLAGGAYSSSPANEVALATERGPAADPQGGLHNCQLVQADLHQRQGHRPARRQVTGELERLGRMMHYDCDVEVNAFGVLATGAGYSQTAAAQCGTNATWVDFYPGADFQPGSKICVRARQGGEWSSPVCLTIKP